MTAHQMNLQVFDYAAATIVVGSLAQIIPAAAASLAVIWYCIQIWESDTVKGWTNRPTKPPFDDNDIGEK